MRELAPGNEFVRVSMRDPQHPRRFAHGPDSPLRGDCPIVGESPSHPGAAASLREGLAETFTVARLDVAPVLARSLRSTNAIESMISIGRDHSSNVKRWRDGTMALRWCAAGMVEAAKRFRRVQGHHHLAALRTALDAHFDASTARPRDTAAA